MTNYFKLLVQLLPTVLRTGLLQKLIMTFAEQLQNLQQLYLSKRSEQEYLLNHSGQVAVLEQVYDDYFGLSKPNGFEIIDSEYHEYRYVTSESSTEPTIEAVSEQSQTDPITLWSERTIGDEIYPYILQVPSVVYNDSNKMKQLRTLVKSYRLPGRKCLYYEKTISL